MTTAEMLAAVARWPENLRDLFHERAGQFESDGSPPDVATGRAFNLFVMLAPRKQAAMDFLAAQAGTGQTFRHEVDLRTVFVQTCNSEAASGLPAAERNVKSVAS